MDWRKVYEKIKVNGKVINHSSHILWVIETTSSSTTAHKLSPGMRSPANIDADGLKRFDGKPINGHLHWWKIRDFTTADIYNDRDDLKIAVLIKSSVPDDHFGKYKKDSSENWGEPIAIITKVKRTKTGAISEYFIERYGWISRSKAIELAAKGKIDNATPVFPAKGKPYLRSRPDSRAENNLGGMSV